MILLHFIFSFFTGHVLALAFGYWHWSIYKRRMIYRKEKALWWCLKLAVVALAAWLLPGVTYKNALVIGFLLWFLFDCFMGYKIHRNIKYTGTESVLDILADSEPWYFWTKFFLIIASIIFYFV